MGRCLCVGRSRTDGALVLKISSEKDLAVAEIDGLCLRTLVVNLVAMQFSRLVAAVYFGACCKG